jgi:hypothetical protein
LTLVFMDIYELVTMFLVTVFLLSDTLHLELWKRYLLSSCPAPPRSMHQENLELAVFARWGPMENPQRIRPLMVSWRQILWDH